MKRLRNSIVAPYLFISLVSIVFSGKCFAQSSADTKEVRDLLVSFYQIDSIELFQCSTRKPSVSRTKAYGDLKRYAESDSFASKRDEMYEPRYSKQDQPFWLNFYSQFFISGIAEKYAKLCDLSFVKLTKNTLGGDVRFPPHYRDRVWIDSPAAKLSFHNIQYEKEGLAQYVRIKFIGEEPFLMRYMFKRENNRWRVSDIGEWYEDPDRRDRPGISLQDELKTWKTK